jgi:putative membrane protein
MNRQMLLPVAAMALLTMCSPRDNRDTGAAGSDTSSTATASAGADSARVVDNRSSKLDDAGILAQLDVMNTAEVQENTAAMKKTSTPALRRWEQMAARDHKTNREQGRALARKLGITPSGAQQVDAAEKAGGDEDLSKKTGKDFDKAFIDRQIDEHQKAVDKLNEFQNDAQNPQLKQFIQQTIPTVQKHTDQLKQVKDQIKD